MAISASAADRNMGGSAESAANRNTRSARLTTPPAASPGERLRSRPSNWQRTRVLSRQACQTSVFKTNKRCSRITIVTPDAHHNDNVVSPDRQPAGPVLWRQCSLHWWGTALRYIWFAWKTADALDSCQLGGAQSKRHRHREGIAIGAYPPVAHGAGLSAIRVVSIGRGPSRLFYCRSLGIAAALDVHRQAEAFITIYAPQVLPLVERAAHPIHPLAE